MAMGHHTPRGFPGSTSALHLRRVRGLNEQERHAIARLDADAMLARTERWCAINSGTRNIAGVRAMADALAGAFAALPGKIGRAHV